MQLCCNKAKRTNLKLTTWPKPLSGSLQLAFTLPGHCVPLPDIKSKLENPSKYKKK